MIINMAERIKDAEDLKLEALFTSEPVCDDGFSACVERQIRRRIQVRRWVLSSAVLLGGAVAAKPLIALLIALAKVSVFSLESLGNHLARLAGSGPLSISLISLGSMAALIFIMLSNVLED